MTNLQNNGMGRVTIEFKKFHQEVLLVLEGKFLTDTKGSGILIHHMRIDSTKKI